MSTGPAGINQVTFDLHPERRNGRLIFRATALLGQQVLLVDYVDIASSRSRRNYLRLVADRSQRYGVSTDIPLCDQLLMDLARQAETDPPETESDESQPTIDVNAVFQAFEIEILGETDDQSILMYVASTRKRWQIKSPARWPELEMVQALGRVGVERLWIGDGPAPEGTFRPEDVRRAVALAASQAPRLSAADIAGQGIWRQGRHFLIVNGGQAFLYNGQGFRRVHHPRIGGRIIDFESSRRWARHLVGHTRAMTATTACNAFSELQGHLSNWNWRHPLDPLVAAALVPATFIQACWTWRPLVTVTGESDCGKSTLFMELLRPIFGSWVIATDRPTEAGVRQALRHDACPVLLDEFDKYKQRDSVLELFRTSSRGGEILRGTQDQSGRRFGVRHIAWFGAIESGDIWGQDRNRRIPLELLLPLNRGALILPGSNEIAELGQQIAAAALWAAPRAIPLADAIKATRIDGVPGRLVECFSVPAAMGAVLMHGREVLEENAVEMLHAMLGGRQELEGASEPEQVRLLRDILSSNVNISQTIGSERINQNFAVAQVLEIASPVPTAGNLEIRQQLEAKGLKLIESRASDNREGRRLFIVPEVVQRHLLGSTRWAGVRIDQLLVRLPGAERAQQRCGGQDRPCGIQVPWPGCLDCIGPNASAPPSTDAPQPQQ